MKSYFLICALLMPQMLLAYEADYTTKLMNVTSIGQWSYDGKKGFYRFITHAVGSEHVRSNLYMQWLTYHEDGVSDSEIIEETEVMELRGYEYASPICNPENKCKDFTMKATESFGHFKEFKFKIVPKGVGKYAISKHAL